MTCSTCIYWQSDNKTCHKAPPVAIHGFPTVKGSDWCGEWADEQPARIAEPQPVMAVVPAPVEVPEQKFWKDKSWRERLGI